MKHKLEIEKALLMLVIGMICFLVGYNCKGIPEKNIQHDIKNDTITLEIDNICRIDSFYEDTDDLFYLIVYQDTTRFTGNIDIYASPEQIRELNQMSYTLSNVDDEYMYKEILDSMDWFRIVYNDTDNVFELYNVK